MSTLANLLKPFRRPAPRGSERHFQVDCELQYEVDAPTEFVFLVHALDADDQHVVSESLDVRADTGRPIAHRVFSDPLSGHRFARLALTEGRFTLRYRATVAKERFVPALAAEESAISDLPDELLPYLSATRYCESDHLSTAAQKMFGALPPGWARVQAIADWIHDNLDYVIGSTNVMTTARDVFVQRSGVCRDYAHLGVTFCRALNIPARLAVGYAVFEDPPPDFHAVFEAWVGGRWVLFDPTRMSPVEDLVRIASGRDAKDLAFATMFGPGRMLSMRPDVEQVGVPPRLAAAAH